MIREGEKEVTLRYLRKHPRLITVSHYSDGVFTMHCSPAHRQPSTNLGTQYSSGTGEKHQALFAISA